MRVAFHPVRIHLGRVRRLRVRSWTRTFASSVDERERQTQTRIVKSLAHQLWPSNPENDPALTLRKQRVAGALALMVSGKVVTLQVPYIFKQLVDMAPDPSTTAAVASMPLALLISYGVARAASTGLQEWRNAVFAQVAQETIRKVGRQVFDHVHSLDVQYHLSKSTGQVSRVLDRGQRSITLLMNAMVFNITPTILEVSMVTGILTYNFGWAHAAVVGGTVASYVVFTVGVTQWRTQFRRDMNRLENQASQRFVDSLVNFETVQYFNNRQHEGQRYEESLKGYQDAALDAQRSLSLLNFGQASIFSVGLTGVMYLTAEQITMGAATPGDLVWVNGLLFQLSVPLFFIGMVYREVSQGLIDMTAMYDLLDQKPQVVDRPGAKEYNPESMGTHISFHDVHFSYPTSRVERPILRGTTLEISPGKTVAIVGSSGCGKSTILRLLYRFYDPGSGTISLGGNNLRDLTKESLQRAMAVVPQDCVLFHDTIAYNINYGNFDASMDEVIDAAKRAHVHDTIMSFPDGYDTVVGERGLKLSGGEKQRVAIARAILQDAPILLCDEPTSSLDSETENEIMSNLKDVGKGRTTIIIAHRLSTIQDCDEIIVMDQGEVAERGSHDDLVRKGGRYIELLKMQETSSLSDLAEDQ